MLIPFPVLGFKSVSVRDNPGACARRPRFGVRLNLRVSIHPPRSAALSGAGMQTFGGLCWW